MAVVAAAVIAAAVAGFVGAGNVIGTESTFVVACATVVEAADAVLFVQLI